MATSVAMNSDVNDADRGTVAGVEPWPALGRVSLAITIALLLMAVGFFAYDRASGTNGFEGVLDPFGYWFFLQLFWIGWIYGLVLAGVWMLSAIHRRWLRHGLRLIWSIAGATALLLTSENPWLRTASNVGLMALAQCTIFFVLQVPSWRSKNRSRLAGGEVRRSPRPVRQFQIADVFFATAVIAVLLGITLRYATPVEPWTYWLVLIIEACATPCVTVCLAFAIFSKRTLGSVCVLVGISVAITAASSTGLAIAQLLTNNMIGFDAMDLSSVTIDSDGLDLSGIGISRGQFELMFKLYSSFTVGYWCAAGLSMLAGRWQWSLWRRAEEKKNSVRTETAPVGTGN